MLLVLFLFQVKHLVCDFFLQNKYMYANKGNLEGHPGGWLHGFVQVLGTFCVGLAAIPYMIPGSEIGTILTLMCMEFLFHTFIDAGKINLCKKMDWTATTSENYWYAMGTDQFLHQAFYIFATWFLFNVS